jgi:hypothetical protein
MPMIACGDLSRCCRGMLAVVGAFGLGIPVRHCMRVMRVTSNTCRAPLGTLPVFHLLAGRENLPGEGRVPGSTQPPDATDLANSPRDPPVRTDSTAIRWLSLSTAVTP